MPDSYLLAAINFSFLYNSMKIKAVNNSNTPTISELSNARETTSKNHFNFSPISTPTL